MSTSEHPERNPFRDRFENWEGPVRSDFWADLERNLDQKPRKKRFWWWIGGFMLFGTLATSFWFFSGIKGAGLTQERHLSGGVNPNPSGKVGSGATAPPSDIDILKSSTPKSQVILHPVPRPQLHKEPMVAASGLKHPSFIGDGSLQDGVLNKGADSPGNKGANLKTRKSFSGTKPDTGPGRILSFNPSKEARQSGKRQHTEAFGKIQSSALPNSSEFIQPGSTDPNLSNKLAQDDNNQRSKQKRSDQVQPNETRQKNKASVTSSFGPGSDGEKSPKNTSSGLTSVPPNKENQFQSAPSDSSNTTHLDLPVAPTEEAFRIDSVQKDVIQKKLKPDNLPSRIFRYWAGVSVHGLSQNLTWIRRPQEFMGSESRRIQKIRFSPAMAVHLAAGHALLPWLDLRLEGQAVAWFESVTFQLEPGQDANKQYEPVSGSTTQLQVYPTVPVRKEVVTEWNGFAGAQAELDLHKAEGKFGLRMGNRIQYFLTKRSNKPFQAWSPGLAVYRKKNNWDLEIRFQMLRQTDRHIPGLSGTPVQVRQLFWGLILHRQL